VDASVEHACKMLDELLTKIEELLESRKLLEQELEQLLDAQAIEGTL
jgi:NADH:ubiquinone oxidoreductase subunit D